jgi:XTP/dITP diphosphohydrolase
MPQTERTPIVLATGNPHKVEELRAIFENVGLGVPIVGLSELPGYPFAEPSETGATFEQNATIKALAYARATGRWCLADDSGLEIDALGGEGGRPGVISSHYCTDGREEGMDRPTRDRLNNERVLRELEGVPAEKRSARFVCVMALGAARGGAGRREDGGAGGSRGSAGPRAGDV